MANSFSRHGQQTVRSIAVIGLIFSSSTCPITAAELYSFDHRVMAVLSRSGCNLGTCHGNLNGKGGLMLSLRGQNPWHDYLALTHDMAGRRINRAAPDDSLVLLKPTAAVPHQGGQRFVPGTAEYDIIRNWILNGAPPPDPEAPVVTSLRIEPHGFVVSDVSKPIEIRAIAMMSNSQTMDVTNLATYETSNFVADVSHSAIVTPKNVGETTVSVRYLNQQSSFRAAFVSNRVAEKCEPINERSEHRNLVDRHVGSKLNRLGLKMQNAAPDHVFLRRAFLDTVGQLPTASEAKAYLGDGRGDKQSRLADRLLADPRFADHWALIWSDLLRNDEKLLDVKGVQRFHKWIRGAFANAMPLNQFVAALVSARGSTYEHAPANYYRAMRDPFTRAESTARLFLGVRLQCAKCHNHPFDRWSQDDYYSWAALFARIDYEIVENKRLDKLDKSEFVGEQRVVLKDEGEVTNVRSGKPARPRYLSLASGTSVDPDGDPLDQLANWLTNANNRAFARAQANRIWFHMMGRGLVDPIDDFRVTNPPTHPELLDDLADELIRSQFDVRHVVRLIILSQAYRAATSVSDANELAGHNYAGVVPRRLGAEQLLDAQCQVLGLPPAFNGYPVGTRAGQLAGVERVRRRDKSPSSDDRFLSLFGKPTRQMSCECERSDATTLTQAFYLINGPGLLRRLNDDNSRLVRWLDVSRDEVEMVQQLFWSALSRPPTRVELETTVHYLRSASSRIEAVRDICWAVLNSKEFLFRQ